MRYMVIDPTGETYRGLGEFNFSTQPKIGEWIEVTENDQGSVYEVLAVVHATDCEEVDIYVKRLGELEEALSRFRDSKEHGLLTWMKLGENP